jgi:integrase
MVAATEGRGLRVVVQVSGTKSWEVAASQYEEGPGGLRLVGTRKRKIGSPSTMDISVARQRARALLGELRRVRPPSAGSMTLGEAWELFVQERERRGRAPRTVANYRAALDRYLAQWKARPLSEVFVDRLGLVRLHAELSMRGPVQANRVVRMLRAVLRRAARLDPALGRPPTDAVEQAPERRRFERAPTSEELAVWYQALLRVTNPVRRDAHLLALLTGLRSGSDGARGGGVGVVSLQWSHVDFDRRLLNLPRTKTGAPLLIPMSAQVEEILKRRRAENISSSAFVFPADSRSGHIASLREKSLSHWGHDLRAAYITHGEAAGVPRELLKRLVGHADNTVTGGYINPVAQIEFFRSAQQLISDRILQCCRGGVELTVVENEAA